MIDGLVELRGCVDCKQVERQGVCIGSACSYPRNRIRLNILLYSLKFEMFED